MNPTIYEGLAAQHLSDLKREALGSQMVARAHGDRQVGTVRHRVDLHLGLDHVATIARVLRRRLHVRATRASA